MLYRNYPWRQFVDRVIENQKWDFEHLFYLRYCVPDDQTTVMTVSRIESLLNDSRRPYGVDDSRSVFFVCVQNARCTDRKEEYDRLYRLWNSKTKESEIKCMNIIKEDVRKIK